MKPNKQYRNTEGVQYAMYPNPVMNITQSINGATSHRGTNAIDDAQENAGISNGYAPCDMVCVATDYINGNAMFWESVAPVQTRKYGVTHIYMMVIHDDTANAQIGMRINQGQQLFSEGTAGFATGNHSHIEVGVGRYPGYMYTPSGYLTSWGATVYMMPGNVNPADIFFVDDTQILASGGLDWVSINNTTSYKEIPEHYAVKFLVDEVRIHQDSPNGEVVGSVYENDIVEYYAKAVYGGHRWIKDADNRWYAISGSENPGEEMWVELVEPVSTPTPVPEVKPNPEDIKLIEEEGVATFISDIPINIRRDAPDGELYGYMSKGEKQHYTHKYIGHGHRYICWYQNEVLCFCAVSATEEQPELGSGDLWATCGPVTEGNPEDQNGNIVKAHGIDISEANSNVQYKNNDFVILRASYGKHTDSLFAKHLKECQKNNIPIGVYHFAYAVNEKEAYAEINYFLNKVKDLNVQVGYWLDLERTDYWDDRNLNTPEHYTMLAKVWDKIMTEKGLYHGIYSGKYYFDHYIKTPVENKWIAAWGNDDAIRDEDLSNECVIHQYTSNRNTLDENVSYVELDTFSTDKKEDNNNNDDVESINAPVIKLVPKSKLFDKYGIKMSYNICPKELYYCKSPYYVEKMKGVSTHNAGTPGNPSAADLNQRMLNNTETKSWHFTVDESEIVQGLPLNRNCFANGDFSTGFKSKPYISYEITRDMNNDPRFVKAKRNGALLAAELIYQNGWDVDEALKKHQDWDMKINGKIVHKYCPHRILDEGWDRYVQMVKDFVQEAYDLDKKEPEKPKPIKPEKPKEEVNISGVNKLINLLNKLINKILAIFK